MKDNHTISLLKECDSGIKMGISSIEDVMKYVESNELKRILDECKVKHQQLGTDMMEVLTRYGKRSKDPNVMIQSMSKMKTNMKLMMDGSDSKVASLITDGCNMGVKSLNKYLNEYVDADEEAKEITKSLIDLEEKLAIDIRRFL